MTNERVGLIGVGLMGQALAERLQSAARTVVGWDVAPAQRNALGQLGGTAAGSAPEVFAGCERVILSLPEYDVVAGVLREADAALRPGQILIDTSTGSPEQAAALGRTLAGRGVAYLDATVSGSSAQVRRGEVLVMVGGDPETFAQCADLFSCFAGQTIHAGPCGSGAKMKLVTNLVLGLNRAALAEGIAFSRTLGLGGEQTLEVLRGSMAYSRIMDTKGEKMIHGDFEPQARLSQHLKDVRLMLDAAGAAGAKLPLSEAHRELLERAEALGLGALDNSAILRSIESLKDTPR